MVGEREGDFMDNFIRSEKYDPVAKKFNSVHKDADYFCKENSSSRKSNVDQNQRTALRASQKKNENKTKH
jgi:hypothetical protein